MTDGRYWQVTIHSVYGADLAAFDTKEEAWEFALDVEKDTDHVYGTEVKYVDESWEEEEDDDYYLWCDEEEEDE